jgi:hypothetical protein
MVKSIPVRPETPELASAVLPEEEHGQRGFEKVEREHSFWMQGIFFLRSFQTPFQRMN